MYAISLRAVKTQQDPSTALATLGSLVMVINAHVSNMNNHYYFMCARTESDAQCSTGFHQGPGGGRSFLPSYTHTKKELL